MDHKFQGTSVTINTRMEELPPKPTALNPPPGVPSRDEDEQWYRALQLRFEELCADKSTVLFTTSIADNLFDVYMRSLPPEDQQYHNCRTCQRFFATYGALVLINKDGKTSSAMWDVEDAPRYYKPAVRAMVKYICASPVTGVFYTENTEWGVAETGEWRHYSVTPPLHLVHTSRLMTGFQKSAEKAEDVKNVWRALQEYDEKTLSAALNVLKADVLYRAEKVIGPAEWLYNLSAATRNTANMSHRSNLVWRAVALAPAGYAHPRSSMAGTLLDDISAGMDLETVKERFAKKMHPLRYQRPTAAPSDGNIKRGEEIVEKLGIASSLKRRYASPEDVAEFLWKPRALEKESKSIGGVFSHLLEKTRKDAHMDVVPEAVLTWAKFCRTVLPDAREVEVLCPQHGNYVPLTTAVDSDAPPILQWDSVEQRNPVCWYVWNGGSYASQWGLSGGSWEPLWGITAKPCHWHGRNSANFGEGVLFLIEGAHESRWHGGLGLFPETLRSELHQVRSTIEAYSRSGVLENTEGPHAAGLLLGSQGGSVTLRVKTNLGSTIYKIDRWD